MSGGVFAEALCCLREAGVVAVLLRDDPDRLAEQDELDLLVAERELGRTVALLAGAGWELSDGGRFHPRKRALLALEGDRLLKLDLHGALVQGPLEYLDAAWMLEGSEPHACGGSLPAREAFAAHVALHVVLGKECLPERLRQRFQAACGPGLERAPALAGAARFGLGIILAEILEEPAALGDPARVAAWRARARRRLRRRPANLMRELVHALVWTLGPPLGLRRAFWIAAIGPDGVGKTSFLAALQRGLHAWDLPARCVYLGPWEPSGLPLARWLTRLGANPLDELPGTGPGEPVLRRSSKRVKGLVKRHLWYASAFLDAWWRHLVQVLPRLLLRRVVLADRCLLDLLVGYYNQPVANSPRLRRALVALGPRPRLCVLLDAEPELLRARKPEYPLEVLRSARAAYRELALRRGVLLLSSDRPPEELAQAFLERHWREFVRWRRA